MKGIYLTQEGKQEIEAEISGLYRESTEQENINKGWSNICTHKALLLEEILSSAIILPVEDSWKLSVVTLSEFKRGELKGLYPNGVIIKQK